MAVGKHLLVANSRVLMRGKPKKTSRLCGYNDETDASMVSLLGVEERPTETKPFKFVSA